MNRARRRASARPLSKEQEWVHRMAAICGGYEQVAMFQVPGMDRALAVPKRYRTIVAAVFDGRPFQMRELAERVGYSLSGLCSALHRLDALGCGMLTTMRGCHGWTRFKRKAKLVALNVRTKAFVRSSSSSDVESSKRTLDRTFAQGGSGHDLWRQLGLAWGLRSEETG